MAVENVAPRDKVVLVFGATGQQGGAVARALRAQGWNVRALVRDPASEKSRKLAGQGIELVKGDFSDEASIRRAASGIHGIFSVQPSSGQGAVYGISDEQEIHYGNTIADIALEAGVQHLVYSSANAAGPEKTGVGHFDSKSEIEAHLRGLDIASTIIRPAAFMELLMLPGMGLDKGMFMSFARQDQKSQLIAVQDIGTIVAGIFADPARFTGRTIEIAGDTVTGASIEKSLSKAAARPITYHRFPDSLLEQNAFLGRLAALVDDGRLAGNANIDALQREFGALTSFDEWLAGAGKPLLDAALQADDQPIALR